MKIAVLTGAGISRESGIETFRDLKDGLWFNHKVEEVATAEGWKKDPKKVLNFHNILREKYWDAKPNAGHFAIRVLEGEHDVTIVTQNVDKLHEAAGSTRVYHIHGEIDKADDSFGKVVQLEGNLNWGDLDEYDVQLKPHTVLFGEMPYHWEESALAIQEADILIIIGTSFSIGYLTPLVASVKGECEVYYVDPKPDLALVGLGLKKVTTIREKASTGVLKVVSEILK